MATIRFNYGLGFRQTAKLYQKLIFNPPICVITNYEFNYQPTKGIARRFNFAKLNPITHLTASHATQEWLWPVLGMKS